MMKMFVIAVAALALPLSNAEFIDSDRRGRSKVDVVQSDDAKYHPEEGHLRDPRKLPSWTQSFWNTFNTVTQSPTSSPTSRPTNSPPAPETPSPSAKPSSSLLPTSSVRPSASQQPSTSLSPTVSPRSLCPDREDVFRTCYARAADPSNDLEEDEIQNGITPYVNAKTEELIFAGLHSALILENATVVTCDDMIQMENLTLQFLKANVGSEDTFFPVCVYNDEIASFNETVDDESGKVVLTVAFKFNLTYVFTKEYITEFEQVSEGEEEQLEEFTMMMEQINARSRALGQELAKCTETLKAECCSGDAVDHKCDSKKRCKESECCKKNGKCKKSAIVDRKLQSSTPSSLEGADYSEFIRSNSIFFPMAAQAVVEASDTADVASCSANRFTINEFDTPSFACDIYAVHDCDNNEGSIYEDDEQRCLPSAPSAAPSISSQPTSSAMPSSTPSISSKPSVSNAPTVVPSLSLVPSTSLAPSLSSKPSMSPTRSNAPTIGECYPIYVNILHDYFPTETSWSFYELTYSGGNIVEYIELDARNSTSDDYGSYFSRRIGCFNDGDFQFLIRDGFGDGICCTYGTGGFNITSSDGLLLGEGGEFRRNATVNISLPFTAVPSMAPSLSLEPSMSATISKAPTVCTSVDIEVLHDYWAEETSWALYMKAELFDDVLVAERNSTWDDDYKLIITQLCLEEGEYEFVIEDSYGDGICCFSGDGYYRIIANGQVLGQGGPFEYEESTLFALPIADMPSLSPTRSLEPSISTSPSIRPSVSNSPTDTCSVIFIDVQHDEYGGETYWSLTYTSTDEIVHERNSTWDDSNEFVSTRLCVFHGQWEFLITDDWGDGICCYEGNGYYNITTASGLLIARGGNFDYEDSVIFEIPFADAPSFSPSVSASPSISQSPTFENAKDLYIWGKLLYFGDDSSSSDTPENSGLRVIDGSAGYDYSMVVRSDGSAQSAGFVEYMDFYRGWLGVMGVTEGINPFHEISQVVDTDSAATINAPLFKRVFAGHLHSVLIDIDGKAWTTGYNGFGQLCLGDVEDRMIPHKIQIDGRIVEAAVGEYHTLLLHENGTVFGCGWNYYGAIGIGSTYNSASSPTKIEGLGSVERVSAGFGHSLFLSSDGLYATGSNWYGELCVDTGGSGVYTPLLLSEINRSEVVSFEAGRSSSYILFANGTVVACGDNYYGSLGDGTNEGKVRTTTLTPTPIEKLGVGPMSYSAFFIDDNGVVYATGYNGDGNLGVGDEEDRNVPTVVDFGEDFNGDVEHISAGEYHTLAMVAN